MSATEVLQLPLRERLQIMEAIWEDLRGRADRFGISQDQKDLLDSRRARVGTGEATILDWDSVKHSIGRV
jgi:putative addiction module component (TIGR02574 family)